VCARTMLTKQTCNKTCLSAHADARAANSFSALAVEAVHAPDIHGARQEVRGAAEARRGRRLGCCLQQVVMFFTLNLLRPWGVRGGNFLVFSVNGAMVILGLCGIFSSHLLVDIYIVY